MHCGSHVIPFTDAIGIAQNLFEQMVVMTSDHSEEWQQYLPVDQLRGLLRSTWFSSEHFNVMSKRFAGTPRDTDIPDLLSQSINLKVTEDKDRIYGMLGLMPASLGIEPRYSPAFSVEEVYRDAAMHIMTGTNSLSLLLLVDGAPEKNRELPSWAPDWRLVKRGIGPPRQSKSWFQYRASASAVFETWSAGRSTLMCGGLVLADISQLHQSFLSGIDHNLQDTQELRSLLADYTREWARLNGVPHPAANVVGKTEQTCRTTSFWVSVWRTLLMDLGYKQATQQYWRLIERPEMISHWGEWILKDSAHSSMTSEDHAQRNLFSEKTHLAKTNMMHRRLMRTSTGLMGTAPEAAREGDVVCILAGLTFLSVLRPCRHQDPRTFTVIGPCYVDGVMDGEAVYEAAERISGDRDNIAYAFDDVYLV